MCVCVCVILPVYCVTSAEDTSSSETDQLFADVKEEVKEIHSDWYSLAIELDIDYATRKVKLLTRGRAQPAGCSSCYPRHAWAATGIVVCLIVVSS